MEPLLHVHYYRKAYRDFLKPQHAHAAVVNRPVDATVPLVTRHACRTPTPSALSKNFRTSSESDIDCWNEFSGLDHGVGHLAYIPTKKNGMTLGFRPKPGVCGA